MLERKTYIPFGTSNDHSIDYLLGIIADARVTTLRRVADISTEELHWQYAEGWNTVGALLSHIYSCEEVFRIEFIEKREINKKEEEKYGAGLEMGKQLPKLITGESIDIYIARLAESRKKIIDAIEQIDTADFFEKRKGYNPNTGYNLAWVLYHLAEDEVHHRGQISLIRKLYKSIHTSKKQR